MCLVYGVFDICVYMYNNQWKYFSCNLMLGIICGLYKTTAVWFMNSCKCCFVLHCSLILYRSDLDNSLLGKRDFVWVHFDLLLLMDRGYQYVAGDVFNIMAVKKWLTLLTSVGSTKSNVITLTVTASAPVFSLVLALWPVRIILSGKVWQI